MAEPARRKTLLQAHAGEPLAVGPDLGALGVEDAEGLLAVGRGVALDVGRAEHGPRGGAARRVADAGGPVADDEHRQVAGVLELAQLAEHDGVPQVDVGRRRVDAELDPQRAAQRELGRRARPGGQARRPSARPGARRPRSPARGKGLERYGEPAQRRSARAARPPREMPMRGPDDHVSTRPVAARAARRGRPRPARRGPVEVPVDAQRLRRAARGRRTAAGRDGPRGARASPARPWSGARARRSTAAPRPSGSHTRLAHQWRP